MKPLMPNLRENNRYVKFQVSTEKRLNTKEFEKGLQEEFLSFLGQVELAKSSFKLVKFSNNKGIVKVNAKFADKLRAMFAIIEKMNNEKITIKSLKTSGLINKVKGEE